MFQPVIKWFGSKRLVAEEISLLFPSYNNYYEPFVGGGALLPYSKGHKGYASDIIPELIALWQLIKQDPEHVAKEYEKRWLRLQSEGAAVYYEVRESFNATRNPCDFLFITRTCVNGMIRYNSDGKFNNSFHLSRPGINPHSLSKIILQWSKQIKNIIFQNIDYRECLSSAGANDLIFLDPPYGGTKDRYTKSDFDLNDFFQELDRLNQIGARWVLTFDGSAGDRQYIFAPPPGLYKFRSTLSTGLSSFKRLIENRKDVITESIYCNFQPILRDRSLFDDVHKDKSSF